MKAAAPIRAGRHCAICGKQGGTSLTSALRALGYERQHYAHAHCVVRERRRRAERQGKA